MRFFWASTFDAPYIIAGGYPTPEVNQPLRLKRASKLPLLLMIFLSILLSNSRMQGLAIMICGCMLELNEDIEEIRVYC